jgi:serine/threonine protein kinase
MVPALSAPRLEVEGRYLLGRRLGRGSSGVVYAARSLAPALRDHGRREVAIKILGRTHVGDPDAVARFTHEAFLASRLTHPNLIGVIDFGWFEEGRPYYVMTRHEGATLDRVLVDAGPLSPILALQFITDVAAGLHGLHRHGIVHRDVKPSNLFCVFRKGRRPRIRIIDLGVAGVFDARRARKLGTVNVGAVGSHGTPAYIAPEQALGLKTDARADVYALACVAYRLLTGVEPFRASTVTQTVEAHLFETAKPATQENPALPAAVDAVLARGMAKNAAQRIDDPRRFAAELARAFGVIGRPSASASASADQSLTACCA